MPELGIAGAALATLMARFAEFIISFIYVDDHYRYTVRSKSEEDYIVNDEYLWNKGDYVSIVIPEDKLTYRVIENN
jgi:hypothetical protein